MRTPKTIPWGWPDYIQFPKEAPSRVLVFVDAEEEFDWSKPVSGRNRSTTHLACLHLAHEIFAQYGIVPHYLVDHPVALDPTAPKLFDSLHRIAPLEIGAQLHPWVTPPDTNDSPANSSYPGNLPKHLEFAKLKVLTETIRTRLGKSPQIYRAGRYGIGHNTAELLALLGYKIDVSVRAGFDYSLDGGPSFRGVDARPFWLDIKRGVLEIPSSSAFVGALAELGGAFHDSKSDIGRYSVRNGFLSRFGLLNRLALTPEGFSIDEAIQCIDRLHSKGTKHFAISFHSPSLAIGNTPYVRTELERQALLSWLREVLKYLISAVGACPGTALDLHREALALHEANQA